MKLIYRQIAILLVALSILLTWSDAAAQSPLSKKEARQALQLIEDTDSEWEFVELSGKLRLDDAPVSPSLKIYMEAGRRLDISVRVPLMGEVGRIQATADSLLLVNKMKKLYWSGSMEEVTREYPGGIGILQSVLLGRTVIFGEGPADTGMASMLSFYPDDEEGWLLMPKDRYQPRGARYGYVIQSDGRPAALVVELEDSEDFLQLDYTWKKESKYDIDVMAAFGTKTFETQLRIDAPKWEGNPMPLVNLDKKYREVDIKTFFSKMF